MKLILVLTLAFLGSSNAIDLYYADYNFSVTVAMAETVLESVVNLVLGSFFCQADCPAIVNSTTIKYKLYPNTDPQNSYEINSANACNYLKPNEKLKFVVSGWMMDANRPWMTDMKNNYSKFENTSMIVVDWTVANINLNYFQAQACVEAVGIVIGEFLASLQNCGIPPNNIHTIGVSLGAHVLSTAAKAVSSSTGMQIYRLTGLEPAGPCFDGQFSRGLHKDDAKIVDVTHTDRGGFGTILLRGDIDFNANTGYRTQPECAQFVLPDITTFTSASGFMNYLLAFFCSHLQSIKDFIRSIDPASLSQSWTNCYFWSTFPTKTIRYGEYFSPTSTTGECNFYTTSPLWGR